MINLQIASSAFIVMHSLINKKKNMADYLLKKTKSKQEIHLLTLIWQFT